MRDGELQEASEAKKAMDFTQGLVVIGQVHEAHHGGGKLELPVRKRQLQRAGYGVADALAVLSSEADEGRRDIDGEHVRSTLGEQAGVLIASR